jgi:hypothetical protein
VVATIVREAVAAVVVAALRSGTITVRSLSIATMSSTATDRIFGFAAPRSSCSRSISSSGDRVMAEGYFQHAEHYFRILNAIAQATQQSQATQQVQHTQRGRHQDGENAERGGQDDTGQHHAGQNHGGQAHGGQTHGGQAHGGQNQGGQNQGYASQDGDDEQASGDERSQPRSASQPEMSSADH